MTDIPALVKQLREPVKAMEIPLHGRTFEVGYDSRDPVKLAAADALEQLHAALREVIVTWEANSGRVYESMGGSNPRVAAIEDAMDGARALVTPPKESTQDALRTFFESGR